jgi:hypothetical protein
MSSAGGGPDQTGVITGLVSWPARRLRGGGHLADTSSTALGQLGGGCDRVRLVSTAWPARSVPDDQEGHGFQLALAVQPARHGHLLAGMRWQVGCQDALARVRRLAGLLRRDWRHDSLPA